MHLVRYQLLSHVHTQHKKDYCYQQCLVGNYSMDCHSRIGLQMFKIMKQGRIIKLSLETELLYCCSHTIKLVICGDSEIQRPYYSLNFYSVALLIVEYTSTRTKLYFTKGYTINVALSKKKTKLNKPNNDGKTLRIAFKI